MLLIELNSLFRLDGVLHRIKVYNFNIFSALSEVLSFRFSKIFYSISRAIYCMHIVICIYV